LKSFEAEQLAEQKALNQSDSDSKSGKKKVKINLAKTLQQLKDTLCETEITLHEELRKLIKEAQFYQ
jgi:ElaB/YqjD/DUF883 family membrane-anchored ribosome-binding protein